MPYKICTQRCIFISIHSWANITQCSVKLKPIKSSTYRMAHSCNGIPCAVEMDTVTGR